MNATIGIFFLATFVEGFVEYFFGGGGHASKPYLKYIALLLGVGAAIAYQVDLLASVGLHSVFPFVDYVISGIIISRGSNFLNDLVKFVRQDETSS